MDVAGCCGGRNEDQAASWWTHLRARLLLGASLRRGWRRSVADIRRPTPTSPSGRLPYRPATRLTLT